MRYGDGKKGNDYVHGWTSVNQRVVWKVRASSSMTFKLGLNYGTTSEEDTGIVRIAIGNQVIEKPVNPAKPKEISSIELEVDVPAGEHELSLIPVRIDDGELMRLHSVTLFPAKAASRDEAMPDEPDKTDVGEEAGA
jgi:hypothetical protein